MLSYRPTLLSDTAVYLLHIARAELGLTLEECCLMTRPNFTILHPAEHAM